jgi:hypothetical protein
VFVIAAIDDLHQHSHTYFHQHQTKKHRPSITESLKWGWVQFLAAFAAVWWLAARLEWAAFRFRAFDARILSDVAPHAQRF